jgi:multimeric flavodoxin WrbA
MSDVYRALDDADVITFAVPLYFFSWPAQIKPVFDRLLPYYSADTKVGLAGRRTVLLAAAGDDDVSCFDGLRKTFELVCGYCGWKIAGEIYATGVYDVGDIAAKGDWLAQAEALGRAL